MIDATLVLAVIFAAIWLYRKVKRDDERNERWW